MKKKQSDRRLAFWMELKDLLAGAAFPLMLMVVLSVSFIGMAASLINPDDKTLAIVMLVIGEILLAAAYVIFGRMSGITSVRKLVQHVKKRDMGVADKQAELGTGEYAAYKGFLIGFISCIPYMIFQFIECLVHNSFTDFVLQYVFGWGIVFSAYASLSPWLNFIMVLFPTCVHGIAYLVGAHMEWNKQQKVAKLQLKDDGKEDEE